MAFQSLLDPRLTPLPAECASDALGIGCANTMKNLCAENTPTGPAMLNENSNCRLWRNFVETAYDLDREKYAPIQQQLDSCITNYCRNAGVNERACSCMNFPFAMEAQCKAQGVRGCSTESNPGQVNQCLGKVFSQVGGGYSVEDKGGTFSTPPYIYIQFPECVPYYCWNDFCWQPDSLLVSSMRVEQQQCAPGVCINVQGVDQVTVSDLTPPASPQTFRPRQLLINSCGRGHTSAFAVFIPTQWTFPVDATKAVPFGITNVGDDILNMKLVTITNNPYKCTAPDITIGPHGSFNFNVTFDNSLLQPLWQQQQDANINKGNVIMAPYEDNQTVTKGFLRSPEFFYTYPSGSTLQTFSFGLELTLTPPVPQQVFEAPVVVNKSIPLALFVVLGVAGVFCLVAIGVLLATQARGRAVAEQMFKTSADSL